MSKVILRDAIAADFKALIEEPLPYRVRAFTAERAGEILGIGGLGFPEPGLVTAFVILKEGAERYRIALHKAGLRTMAYAREAGIHRVVAVADQSVAPAENWLLRLGFERVSLRAQTAFVWKNEAVSDG